MNGSVNDKDKNKMPRRKLTRTETVLAVALAGVVIYLIYNKFTTQEKIVKDIECADPACYESIIEIRNFIDPSVDPCKDFHHFVCGNFLQTAYTKQVSDIINQEKQELTNEVEGMMIDQIFSVDSEPVRIQKTFFHACVYAKADYENQRNQVLNLVQQIGGWPSQKSSNWTENTFDWINVMIKCKRLGLPFEWFLEFGIYADEINYLKVSHPTLPNQFNSTFRRNYMHSSISLLLKKSVDIKEIWNFEQKLIELIRKQQSDLTLNSIGDLKEMNPPINWSELLTNITDFEMSEETLVASNVDKYIVGLHQLLIGTPKRTQANYIVWKIIEHFAPYMFGQGGTESEYMSRLEFCKNTTRDTFPYLTQVEYIRKYSTAKATQSADELKNLIRREFLNRIEDSTWWNSTAAQIYLETFDQTEIDVGLKTIIKEEDDDNFVDSNYLHIGDLSVENLNFIEMIAERSKYYYQSLFNNINKTSIEPEEKELVLQAAEINIFFHEFLNRMTVPPALLHGFSFDYIRPKYLNFGGLGTLLAKEFITHLQTLTKDDVNVTNVAFEASNRCFEDDYLHIMSEEKIDFSSSDLVREILPDILARDIAYKAYQTWVATNGEEIELPFLPYTPNQLFWIKSGVINCYKNLTHVEDETHFDLIVSKYKNLLSARHSRFFAADFGCPVNTAMNPKEKC